MRWLIILAACEGAAPAPPLPIERVPPARIRPPCEARGYVLDVPTHEPLLSASVVFSGGPSEDAAGTDDSGYFSLTIDGRHDTLTVHYGGKSQSHFFDPSEHCTLVRVPFDPDHLNDRIRPI